MPRPAPLTPLPPTLPPPPCSETEGAMIFNDERALGPTCRSCLLQMPCTHVRSSCRNCLYAVLVGTRSPLSVQLRPSNTRTGPACPACHACLPCLPVCLSVCHSEGKRKRPQKSRTRPPDPPKPVIQEPPSRPCNLAPSTARTTLFASHCAAGPFRF